MSQYKIQRSLPVNPRQNSNYEKLQDQKLRKAAQMYEEKFLNTMVAQMRKTVPKSGLVKESFTENYFRNQLDQNYVTSWAKKGGIGLADIIYSQIKDKLNAAKTFVPRPSGPLPVMKGKAHLNMPKQQQPMPYKIQQGPAPEGEQGVNFHFKKNDSSADKNLQSPWDAEVKAKHKFGDTQIIDLDHGKGLRSVINYQGSEPGFSVGDNLRAGDYLGSLSDESEGFLWSVRLKS